MKSPLIPLLISIGFIGAFGTLRAESAKADEVVELLQQAKASTEPMPILEKAKKQFSVMMAAPRGAGAVGPKKHAGLMASGHEHKQRALDAIDEAIAAAKAGGDPKPKIEHAISSVHSFADLKN